MATSAERSVDLPVPADAAFDAACRALSSLGFALSDADRAMGIIAARSPGADADDLALYVQPADITSSTVIIRPSADPGRGPSRNADALDATLRHEAGIPLSALPPPPGSAAPAVPAGWHPDPSGRHQYRWWAGSVWTDAVQTNGTTTTDPLSRS